MSFTSYSFKDNIVINNSKWIRWLNSSGTTRANILGVDSNNVYLNSGSENLYINNNSNSYTFINNNNSNNVIIGSKLAIGINTTANLNATVAIENAGYIGSNVKNGHVGLSGSYSSSHTDGSIIRLYGNDSSNYGQIHLIAGNHTTGHLNFYTGNNSLKMQIMNTGLINFSPNGSDTKLSISNDENIISNITKITNSTDSIDSSSGALQISGGLSVTKNLYVGESLITGNLVYGNVSYGNIYTNSLNVGVSKTISGLFSASNNISSPTNITGLAFDGNNIRSFQGSVSIAIVRSSGGNLYETINIEANYTEAGWTLFTTSIGDITGVNLSITSLGQLRYISTNQSNWTSTTFRYVITYISTTNNYEGLIVTSGTFIANAIQLNDSTNAILNSQNGSFYTVGGGTFDKDLIVKGDINFVGNLYNNGNLFTSGESEWKVFGNNIGFTRGNVGIGTTSPNAKLDVVGSLRITSGGLLATFNSNTVGALITTGGNIGIGTTSPDYKLHVEGDIYASGSIVSYSDITLKKDITSIDNALYKVSNLRGVEYTMINSNERNIGVVAQEVEKICPQLVVSKDNMKGVCYGNMVGLLIEAIKELNDKIKELEKNNI